ncbi:MAG: DUF559 domain-containing protein [Sphingobium sp.]
MDGQDSPLPRAGGSRETRVSLEGGGPAPTFRKRATRRAKELRNEATPPERRLWQHLRNRQLGGHKFSRQIPVGPYFCDFLCREQRLIVELDGATHAADPDHDQQRDAYCIALGFRVLRFTNADTMSNIEGVLQEVSAALGPPPAPPASGRGEG